MTDKHSKRVLIVEDDPDIRELVDINIRDIGLELDMAGDGIEGFEKATQNKYDMIILDLMLPGMDGMEICKKLRANKDQTPILMLTAKSQELDRVLGLELGADDYLTKPFSIRELLARIKALLRRSEITTRKQDVEKKSDNPLHFGDLVIDTVSRKVKLKGETVQVTAKELDLLQLLASNPGHTFTRQELLDKVWGYQFEGYEHTVNSHINRLRTKIEEDASQPVYLKTVWGIGYRFVEQEELAL
jgi:two-component system alkaline phosphatase synthesis response regulator PhoP